MKKRPNAALRHAASLSCRTDAAIERMEIAIRSYEKGDISATQLICEASAAASRVSALEESLIDETMHCVARPVYHKCAEYRACICKAARVAMGFESDEICRRQALDFARMVVRLQDRKAAYHAHELLWAATGGLPTEEEFEAFEACEIL